MKFGKSIGSQQDCHGEFHYIDYKALKKHIKEIVERQQDRNPADALTSNTNFENALCEEIGKVNNCFSNCQQDLMCKTAVLAEELHRRKLSVGFRTSASAAVADSSSSSCLSGSWSRQNPEVFKTLVSILSKTDQLRKYAVWNAVAVVKILKKRRKQTTLGIEDTAAERSGWLARQTFFNGSDFAELHAAIESLGHMLVLSELSTEHSALIPRGREQEQCPICLDTISDMVELSCNHRFCWKCFVLGPIAYQPGEYRITQCPICRKEHTCAEPELGLAKGVTISSTEGMLTRFLHTYFPQEAAQASGELDRHASEGGELRDVEATSDGELRDVVGELVRVLLADSGQGSRGASPTSAKPGAASSCAAIPSSFFQTLPKKGLQNEMVLGNLQKLQWLQLASTNDPFAVDLNSYCSLCSEPLLMESVVVTPCKHYFHRVCIERVDLPECPLCSSELPLSWFLPHGHPCIKAGFNVVPSHSYQPVFPGGPSRGSSGYPLHRPPPAELLGPDGIEIASYLHKVVLPAEDVDAARESTEAAPTSETLRRQLSPDGDSAYSEDSESSESEDTGSEANDEVELFGGSERHRRERWGWTPCGKMRLVYACAGGDQSTQPRPSGSEGQQRGTDGHGFEPEQRKRSVLLIDECV